MIIFRIVKYTRLLRIEKIIYDLDDHGILNIKTQKQTHWSAQNSNVLLSVSYS